MNRNQGTIKESFSISGKGIHTGVETIMTLYPDVPFSGINFHRSDISNSPVIPAEVYYVSNTDRNTTLQNGGASIQTIEHLLAAFSGTGVTNVMVKINGPEVPILDGSAQKFTELLLAVGVQSQEPQNEIFKITEEISITIADSEYLIIPNASFELEVEIDYPMPIGKQVAQFTPSDNFQREIASSRTFCFLEDAEYLYKNNLIQGGDLNNALVFSQRAISSLESKNLASIFEQEIHDIKDAGLIGNQRLRFENEPARHKLLDLMGDLMLLGQAIQAKIIAKKPGHTSNIAMIKKINELASINSPS